MLPWPSNSKKYITKGDRRREEERGKREEKERKKRGKREEKERKREDKERGKRERGKRSHTPTKRKKIHTQILPE
jgi:hypothetical protein